MPWAALSEALVWVLKQDLRLERLHWAPVVGCRLVQGGKNMISYLLFWIKTLYVQICSPGEQTLLNYTKESHGTKPFSSSQTWTAACQATVWDRWLLCGT